MLDFVDSISDRALSALLYAGQPEQAEVPPVPSQRPSPGQVPPERWEAAGLEDWF